MQIKALAKVLHATIIQNYTIIIRLSQTYTFHKTH
jgi:hypothetical protein